MDYGSLLDIHYI